MSDVNAGSGDAGGGEKAGGYRLRVSSEAVRGLDRLPARVAPAVVEFITVTLLEDPWRISKPLRGDLEGLRSARRGDYRVLVRIHDTAVVEVIRVAHRGDAYRAR